MLEYIYGHDQAIAQWVAEQIPAVRERGFGRCTAIGVVNEQQLVAGFVYHDYNPEAGVMQISGASVPGTRWCTPLTLAHIYRYPFLGAGCQMIVQMVPADNERLLRQLAALGYRFVLVERLLGREQDAIIARLTYEAWTNNKLCRRYQHHLIPNPLEEAA